MEKKALKTLKSQGGETISEVLIALLVSALALTMLASMITSSSRMVTGSMRAMTAYIAEENNIVDYSGTYETGEVTLKMKGLDGEEKAWILSNYSAGGGSPDSSPSPAVSVRFYTCRVIGNTAVISYKVS